jgi:2-C-methyl-D-erythritol 4-phosphate cytidylyltransferase
VEATDDASLVLHYGYRLATVEGDPLGRKITYPEDLEAFERRLSSR